MQTVEAVVEQAVRKDKLTEDFTAFAKKLWETGIEAVEVSGEDSDAINAMADILREEIFDFAKRHVCTECILDE